MHRVVWLTDLHLNFADESAWRRLADEVNAANPQSILVGGDIGEAHNVVRFLGFLDELFQMPMYVVLGNHDFYRGSITAVRAEITQLCARRSKLVFLTASECPIGLTDQVGLIGHDGWADGREGDYHGSLVMLNDYRLIAELAGHLKQERLQLLHRLGDEAAEFVRRQLASGFRQFRQLVLLTHVPPFREACWHEGRISDDEWAPHFVCQAMGRAILEVAALFPDQQVTVLCGHTHSSGECRPAHNVTVITGKAEYGTPRITGTFDFQ